jgi:hypothetical protein
MRTRFQFVFLTLVTIEVQDRLRVFGLRHSASALGIADSVEGAVWSRDAGASASLDASASCYGFAEYVWVLAVVVAELKFRQVERQILSAHIVIRANDATLEQCPEGIEVLGMHAASHILSLSMVYRFMRKLAVQMFVAYPLIRSYKINLVTDSLADKAFEGACANILDHLADNIPFTTDCSDNSGLTGTDAASSAMLTFALVFVPFLSTNESFVNFHDTQKFLEILVVHTGAKPMADVPSGVSRRALAEIHSPYLSRRDALLALKHCVKHLEPSQERYIRVLENRSDEDREPIGAIVLVGFITALPSERPRRAFVDLRVAAKRTLWAIRPAAHCQKETTGFFIGERRHEFLKGLHGENNTATSHCSQVSSHSPNLAQIYLTHQLFSAII